MLPADSVWGASCALVSMTTVQFIQFWRPRVGGVVPWAGIAGLSMVRAARAGRMKHLQAGCLQPTCTGSRSVTRGMPGEGGEWRDNGGRRVAVGCWRFGGCYDGLFRQRRDSPGTVEACDVW